MNTTIESQYHARPACKNCTNRKLGCHDTCESYILFKEKLAEEKRQKELDKLKRYTPSKKTSLIIGMRNKFYEC